MGDSFSYCHSCGEKLEKLSSFSGITVGRKDECHHCAADLHVCLNCEFYDTGSYNSCRESSAEVVLEKDRANFCDYFSLSKGVKGGQQASKEGLLEAAESLFKK